jgi:hypothetical protein
LTLKALRLPVFKSFSSLIDSSTIDYVIGGRNIEAVEDRAIEIASGIRGF